MGLRGKHSGADLVGVRALRQRIAPPDDLDASQSQQWVRIAAQKPADAYRPEDVPLLRAFVVAETLHRQATEMIAREGITVGPPGKERMHPAVSVMTSAASTMAQLAMKLRLCPQSRYETRAAAKIAATTPMSEKPWQREKVA